MTHTLTNACIPKATDEDLARIYVSRLWASDWDSKEDGIYE